MRRAVLATIALGALGALGAGALAGCDWDLERMNDQPRCKIGGSTPYLPDQRCSQATPAGAVAWQSPATGTELVTATRETIVRGQDRFARFCAACHGSLGDGRSVVAADMLQRPPRSLHDPVVVDYPDQRLFTIIGEGYGVMPAYAPMLPPADRWAIVHFVRVLQRSQSVALDELSPAHRQEAAPWLP